MVGLEVIKKGSYWRIGDGNSVRIWHNKWIPDLHEHKLTISPPHFDNPIELVSELIDWNTNTWNLEAIEQWISPLEKRAIQSIYLLESGVQDELIWCHATNGEYSVKFSYHLLSSG